MLNSEAPQTRIELFGGPRVRLADGTIVTFQAKPGAVLALLALAPGSGLAREELAEAIWPDEDPEATRARLRTALAALRTAIPDGERLIPRHTQTICLQRSLGLTVDADEIDALLELSRNAESADAAIAHLEQVVSLGRGRFCPGIYADAVIRAGERYAQKLEEARRALVEIRADRGAARPIGRPAADATPGNRAGDLNQPAARVPRSSRARFGRLAAVLIALALAAALPGWIWLRPHRAAQNVTVADRLRILDATRHAGPMRETQEELDRRRERQAEQCLALAELAWKSWYGPEEQAWIETLRPRDGDIQTSLKWLLDHDPWKAMKLAGALSRYWWILGKQAEARRWLEPALRLSATTDSPERARALALHAMCCLESVMMFRPEARRNNARVLAEMQQANAMYTRLGDRQGEAHTLRCMGHIFHALGRKEEAERSFEAALGIYRADGLTAGEAYTLWGLSLVRPRGATRAAESLREAQLRLRSVQLFRGVGNDYCLALVFRELSNSVNAIEEQPDLATSPAFQPVLRGYLDECRARLDRPEVRNSAPEMLAVRKRMARVAIALGDDATAVEQLGWLLGEVRDIEGARYVRLIGAYLKHINKTPNPPLSESEARSSAYGEATSYPFLHPHVADLLASGSRMTLPAAIAEATQ